MPFSSLCFRFLFLPACMTFLSVFLVFSVCSCLLPHSCSSLVRVAMTRFVMTCVFFLLSSFCLLCFFSLVSLLSFCLSSFVFALSSFVRVTMTALRALAGCAACVLSFIDLLPILFLKRAGPCSASSSPRKRSSLSSSIYPVSRPPPMPISDQPR